MPDFSHARPLSRRQSYRTSVVLDLAPGINYDVPDLAPNDDCDVPNLAPDDNHAEQPTTISDNQSRTSFAE